MFGYVGNVSDRALGSIMVSWVGSLMQVTDASDFPPSGQLTMNSQVYDYLSIEAGDEYDQLTMSIAAPAGIIPDTPVYVWPIATEKMADVHTADGGDPVPCIVPHALKALLPDGGRLEDEAESVEIEEVNGAWTIKDVLGVTPELDGEVVKVGDVMLPERLGSIDSAITDAYNDLQGQIESVSLDGMSTYSPNPAPLDPLVPGKAVGATWYQLTGGNPAQTIAWWQWDGTTWVKLALSETFLPKVNIGTGTYGSLDGARLTARSVGAESLFVGSLDNLIQDGDPLIVDDLTKNWTTILGNVVGMTHGTWGNVLRISRMDGQTSSYIYTKKVTTVAKGDQFYLSLQSAISWGNESPTPVRGDSTLRIGFRALKADGSYAFVYPLIQPIASVTDGVFSASFTVTDPTWRSIQPFVQVQFPTSTDDDYWYVWNMVVRRKATGKFVVDGTVDVSALKAGSLEGFDFYSPSQTATPRVHVGNSTVEVIRSDGEAEFQTVQLGGGTADQVMLYDAAGNIVAGFDSDGSGAARSMTVANNLAAASVETDSMSLSGTDIMDFINPLPRGVVARQKLGTTAAGNSVQFGSTWLGYYELYFDSYTNRVIQVRYTGLVYCSAAGTYSFELRSTSTPGYGSIPSSPKSNGTGIQVAIARINSTGAGFYQLNMEAWFNPYGGQYRVLLSAQAPSGAYGYLASNDNWPAWFIAEDKGTYVGFSDGGYNRGGGTPYSGTPPVETAPPKPKQTYTTTWNASWMISWRGTAQVTDALQQGYYGGYQRYSAIGFPAAVQTALTGSQIAKIEVWLENMSWYYGGGGKARIGYTSATSAPGSLPSGSATFDSPQWTAGTGKWVTIPSSWYSDFATGAKKGITLGEGAGTNMTYYGKFRYALASCKLRATYTK